MTTAPARPHDLPPLWDGRAVQWSNWHDDPFGSLTFHTPADHWACTGCGWIRDTQLWTTGILMPEVGVTDPHPLVRLIVLRCPGCHLDQVTDIISGDVWDLDATDYTEAGSWADTTTTQATLF